MTITEAQQEMRRAFVGGGPGTCVSGLIWLSAAITLKYHSIGTAYATLFFGGMLIFPLTQLVTRFLFGQPIVTPGNPLSPVVLESTAAMIAGLWIAWLFHSVHPAYVFPIAAIAVGTHYAAFQTVYGDKRFWLLAALITFVGVADIVGLKLPGGPALAVASIEILSGMFLTFSTLRRRPALARQPAK
jgi:hypothetical protein